jgi:hypothetical protein
MLVGLQSVRRAANWSWFPGAIPDFDCNARPVSNTGRSFRIACIFLRVSVYFPTVSRSDLGLLCFYVSLFEFQYSLVASWYDEALIEPHHNVALIETRLKWPQLTFATEHYRHGPLIAGKHLQFFSAYFFQTARDKLCNHAPQNEEYHIKANDLWITNVHAHWYKLVRFANIRTRK